MSSRGAGLRVLGIDPGSITTGWGVVERGAGGAITLVGAGEIRAASAGRGLALRLLKISRELADVIKRYSPGEAAVEAVFFARNARSAIILGHARGAALLTAAASGIEVHEYAPSTIKGAVTGYGGAAKQEIQKMVNLLLKNSVPYGKDAADAIAIALCHAVLGAARKETARLEGAGGPGRIGRYAGGARRGRGRGR